MEDLNTKSENELLRTRALDLLKNKKGKAATDLKKVDLQKLLHELEVYCVELELQNEELIRAKDVAELAAEKYTGVYETLNSNYFTLTREGRIAELNLRSAAMLGKDRTELLNSSLAFFLSRESVPIFDQFLARVFESRTGETCEVLFSVNGTLPVYAYISGIITPNENFCHLSVTDTADGSLTEVKLLKANRIYAFSSQINQAVIRIHDRTELFDETCRIAIEYGKFHMACIGLLDESTKNVIPVSFAGVEEEYLTRIKKNSTDNVAEWYGPICTAVREERYVICDDIADNTIMAPWKDEALSRGYRSSIALPLKSFGKIVGAFALYSNIPHFFDKQETDLLVEVAKNISFALENIEQEIRQRKSEPVLKESRELFQLFIQNSPYYAYIKEVTPAYSRVLHASDNFIDMVGISGRDMAGKTMQELFPPELAEKMTFDDWQVVSGGKTLQLDETLNGRFYTTIKFPIILGEKRLLAGYTIDITERRKAEETIQRDKAILRLFVENSPAAAAMFDRDMRFIVVSNRFQSDYGIAGQNVIERSLYEVFPDIPDNWKEIHKRCLAGASAKADEDRFKRTSGELDWVRWEICPWYERPGEIGGIILFSELITTQKLAEATRNRLLHILESSLNEIYVFDATTYTFEYVNKGALRNLGFTMETMLKMTPLDLKPEFDSTSFNKLIEPLKNHQQHLLAFETIHRRADGSFYPIEVYLQLVENNGDKVFLAVIQDITERKKTEELLRISEEKFRKAFETSPDVININRLKDGMFISVNHGFTNILGFSEEEVLGKTSLEINIWHDSSEKKKLVAGLKKEGFVENLVARFRHKDGSLIYGMISARLIELDGILHILSITRNINERIKIEQALQASEEKYRSIFENVQDVYYETLLDGTILEVSPSISILSYGNYSSNDLTGRSMYEFYADPRQRDNLIETIKKSGRINGFEIQLINKDDTIIHCSLSAKIRFSPDGQPLKIIGSMHNISRRKHAEDELLRLNETLEQRVVQRTEQLEKANAELESFSYSVSHDLRTPLRHIEGFIELFLDNRTTELSDEELGYLDIVSKSTEEMGRLIDALLSFSRLNKSDFTKTTINTKLMVNKALKFFADEIRERNIKIHIGHLPESIGDPQLLGQVWNNLLSNAIKYTSKKEKAVIEIGSFLKDFETIFFVKDNGAGFNMLYAGKLFGVFQRLHRPKDFEGVGIGLANVKRIITRHGGHCWAEGEVEKGATVYFSLPDR